MKVVSSKGMAAIEGSAYNAGSSEGAFMEAAGRGVAAVVTGYLERHRITHDVVLICGKGNNGGDAYVAGCYLMDAGIRVHAFQVGMWEVCSPLCQQNGRRFEERGGRVICDAVASTLAFPVDGVIVDALLGTGMRGAPRAPYDGIIAAANDAQLPIIAVDIPSGLNGDTGETEGEMIQASMTIFLGLPKLGFFLGEGWNCVGSLSAVDFGLPHEQIAAAPAAMMMTTQEKFHRLLPPIKRNRHKYEAGYVVGLAGSPGMPGAANLAAAAALRAGAGIVRLLHPRGMEAELAASLFELIKTGYDYGEVDAIAEVMNRAAAVFIGPGIGVTEATRKLLRRLLPQLQVPTLLDADALTIVAEEEVISLPKVTLLTPHIGEMRRLLAADRFSLTQAAINRCHTYAEEKGVTLLLKGGPTCIFSPGRTPVVNPTGSPGMATAGSGDVLTGVITALLAQGLSPFDAAAAGAYLHGVAGELATEEKTAYCMTASDLIAHFPQVFKTSI